MIVLIWLLQKTSLWSRKTVHNHLKILEKQVNTTIYSHFPSKKWCLVFHEKNPCRVNQVFPARILFKKTQAKKSLGSKPLLVIFFEVLKNTCFWPLFNLFLTYFRWFSHPKTRLEGLQTHSNQHLTWFLYKMRPWCRKTVRNHLKMTQKLYFVVHSSPMYPWVLVRFGSSKAPFGSEGP